MQVQGVNDNITDLGQTTWNAAKTAVTKPSTLLALFRRNGQPEQYRSSDGYESDDDADDGQRRRQLLPYHAPRVSPPASPSPHSNWRPQDNGMERSISGSNVRARTDPV